MARGDLIQIRKGTAAQWASVNPILAAGELGLETDTGKIKGGNGTDAWDDLPYSGHGGGGGGGGSWGSITGTLSSQTDLQAALNGKENLITSGTTAQYYRGDKTFQTLNKAAVGLFNVDNTADLSKPISTSTQTALDTKQDTLVSGTNIKTINGTSVLGSGDLIVGGSNNLDGGSAASTYGGSNTINGGGASG